MSTIDLISGLLGWVLPVFCGHCTGHVSVDSGRGRQGEFSSFCMSSNHGIMLEKLGYYCIKLNMDKIEKQINDLLGASPTSILKQST